MANNRTWVQYFLNFDEKPIAYLYSEIVPHMGEEVKIEGILYEVVKVRYWVNIEREFFTNPMILIKPI